MSCLVLFGLFLVRLDEELVSFLGRCIERILVRGIFIGFFVSFKLLNCRGFGVVFGVKRCFISFVLGWRGGGLG